MLRKVLVRRRSRIVIMAFVERRGAACGPGVVVVVVLSVAAGFLDLGLCLGRLDGEGRGRVVWRGFSCGC